MLATPPQAVSATPDRRRSDRTKRSNDRSAAPDQPFVAMSDTAPWTRLDRTAAELGHQLGPLRLAFGEALNALDHGRGYHDLGFSSLNAYATERASKPKRWVAESRALAANLERLSTLRRQLLSGRLPWTRTDLLAKLVERSLLAHDITNPDAARALRPALELSWFFRSSGLTCRELDDRLRSLSVGTSSVSAAESLRCLTLTVPTEDTWWFQAAERTFRRVAERNDLDAFLEALLAETQNELDSVGATTREREGLDARDRWRAELNRWRTRAERLCERGRAALPRPRRLAQPSRPGWPSPEQLRSWSPAALNQHILALAKELHINAAALGRSAAALQRVEAWRHLGFASAGHYARDRLGVSLSSLKQKRALARRLATLPHLAQALEAGQLGTVAASLVARIATAKTERSWVERARQRTVKHLREEIAFVERIQRSRPGHRSWPPAPDVMRAELALRGAIVSGQVPPESVPPAEQQPTSGPRAHPAPPAGPNGPVNAKQWRSHLQRIRDYSVGVNAGCAQRPAPPTPPTLTSDGAGQPRRCASPPGGVADTATRHARCTVAARGQTSVLKNPANAATACHQELPQCTHEPASTPRMRRHPVTGDGLGVGSTRLRLRVCESTLLLYRDVARAFARKHPTRRLLRGLCEHFLSVWSPVIACTREHKYAHIYERDAYTCTSPVCDRHDVTPHHLKFRSQGGGDEPENLASLCVWCHLEGVHGGRLRAEPRPQGVRWTIGRVAPMLVVDRDKIETS